MRDFLVLATPEAGSHDEENLDAALRPARDSGARVEVLATDDLEGALRQRGDRVVVAAGGDGSLHTVVQALHDVGGLADTVVGLIPLGTGNDFARAAGIPLEPEDAGRLLVEATARPTDLVLDDQDQVVVNATHAGLGADASHRAAELKERFGVGAYALGALIEGAKASGTRATVAIDGQVVVEDEEVLLVGVGNGSSIGGGTPLFPDAVLDDGMAEVVVCLATSPAARVGFATSLRNGGHVDRDDVLTAQGREVTISGDEMRHCPDGEVSDPVGTRRYRLVPAAWQVLRPIA
jgi:YegS/Rv2252/BmrU family lipid kinase